VILTSGCFDGIHAGHIAFFQKLRRLVSGRISVAVASDAYIKQAKGRAPRFDELDRLTAVKGIVGVSDAFLHDERGIFGFLEKDTRDWEAFAKGLDWSGHVGLQQLCDARGMAFIAIDSDSETHNSRADQLRHEQERSDLSTQ
jgi:cytidyltransferase-like protein